MLERIPLRKVLTPMKYILARILSVTALGAVVAGCAAVPGDPYYEPARYPVYGQQPNIIYNAPPVYSVPQVYRTPPVIYPSYTTPPTTIYYGGRDRDEWRGRDQNSREDWRERDRDRAERDRSARERERRDQQARDANQQRAREHDQARREQADRERDRRPAEARRPRNDRDRRQEEGNTMPGPNDWRARQQSNSFDKP